MSSGERGRRSARGFTYVGLLALIVLIGLMLAAAGEVASTAAQRERESQLLWVGHEYRAAIARYWGQTRAFPPTLQDLLGSAPDAKIQVRYIRRLYPDPMTNAVDWVVVPAPNGGIMGVASSSKRPPLKTRQFEPPDQAFEGAAAYSDWQFTFQPPVARPRRTEPRPVSPRGSGGKTEPSPVSPRGRGGRGKG